MVLFMMTCPGIKEEPDDVRVAVFTGIVQRHTVETISGVHIGAGVNKKADNAGVAVLARIVEGVETLLVFYVDIGALLDQKTNDVGIALVTRTVEGRETVLVLRVRVGARLYKEAGYIGVAVATGNEEGGLTVFILRVDMCAPVEQKLDDLRVPPGNRVVKRGPVMRAHPVHIFPEVEEIFHGGSISSLDNMEDVISHPVFTLFFHLAAGDMHCVQKTSKYTSGACS